ncbi:unnamed protein product [Linum trigynum]|uniref:Uncharacterized protein n=1 Tax=Linum trigynum TaxID=586398 RepID=A0AAV2CV21_9ROSI
MLRDALSSLFLIISLVGRWLSRVAAVVLAVCVRNQFQETWLPKLAYPVRSEAQEKGRQEAPLIVSRPLRVYRDFGWRGERRNRVRKRSLPIAVEDHQNFMARPWKRSKQGPRILWRFWLPLSSDLDEEVSEFASFAGRETQSTTPKVKQAGFCGQKIQSIPFGGGTRPGTVCGVEDGSGHLNSNGNVTYNSKNEFAKVILT